MARVLSAGSVMIRGRARLCDQDMRTTAFRRLFWNGSVVSQEYSCMLDQSLCPATLGRLKTPEKTESRRDLEPASASSRYLLWRHGCEARQDILGTKAQCG
jgi:hypothetical protein